MVVLVDNYDSFTYNLFQYYLRAGVACTVVRNDVVSVALVVEKRPSLIVLSPGPGGPATTGNCHRLIEAFVGRIPIFGVCLGLQTLAAHFGATVGPAREPMHGKLSTIEHDGAGVFCGVPSPTTVTRYHSLIVSPEGLDTGICITARTSDGEIMGLRDTARRFEGVQFHPEALLTENGFEMVRNSLEMI